MQGAGGEGEQVKGMMNWRVDGLDRRIAYTGQTKYYEVLMQTLQKNKIHFSSKSVVYLTTLYQLLVLLSLKWDGDDHVVKVLRMWEETYVSLSSAFFELCA
jgi:hypothetical protein